MVKHIILWKLKDCYTDAERNEIMQGIKDGLEGLYGKIPGLLEIHVRTEKLSSSNVDVMLDSSFTDETALNGYTVHPDHMDVALNKVRPFTEVRSCIDYEF